MNPLSFEQLQFGATLKSGLQCPDCNSGNHMKYGSPKGKQRYRCKNCGRTFNSDHGTPYFRLRKRVNTEAYLQAMFDGLSIRNAAKKAGITVKTSFQWRHKFLRTIPTTEFVETDGIIGISIIKQKFSSKGQPKKEDSKKPESQSLLQITTSGKINITHLPTTKATHEASRILLGIARKAKIVTHPSRFINQAIRRSGKTEQQIVDSEIMHIYNNKLIQTKHNIEQWMARFRGVATKYLSHYWGWFSLSTMSSPQSPLVKFMNGCVSVRSNVVKSYLN